MFKGFARFTKEIVSAAFGHVTYYIVRLIWWPLLQLAKLRLLLRRVVTAFL